MQILNVIIFESKSFSLVIVIQSNTMIEIAICSLNLNITLRKIDIEI